MIRYEYQEEIDEMFKEHHSCAGLDDEEIEDMINESTFVQRMRWLRKVGYHIESNIL